MTKQHGASGSESIVLDGSTYFIYELSEYGFKVRGIGLSNSDSGNVPAVLGFGTNEIEVAFRERDRRDDESICSFVRLSLEDQQAIRRYLDKKSRVTTDDSLSERTYDELASGVVTSDATKKNEVAPANSTFAKSLAMMVMLFAMAALALAAFAFLKSRGSLAVTNSSLVGNFLPINAKVPGEIVNVRVREGDFVRKGDVLVELANSEMETAIHTLTAQMETADARVRALTRQMKGFQKKLDIAKKKLSLDLDIARSQRLAAAKSRDVAAAVVQRYEPYVQSGAVTRLEFNAATNELLAANAALTAAESQMRQIEFTRDSASDQILILGDRFDDEASRVETDLEIAKAELHELHELRELTSRQVQQLKITAPRDGQIYAMYHQAGEYLRIADEVVALSHPGNVWASGQVSASQASRVRPGQPVEVQIPSLGKSMEGVVTAVGHRAVYARGHYSSEFRGTLATDVPVKVAIADLPDDVPSGIRLDLSISTGYGVKWLDDFTGYELKSIGSDTRSVEPDPEVNQVAVE